MQLQTQAATLKFSPTSLGRGLLQRKCACGQHTGGGQCAECSKKKQEVGQGSTGTLLRLPGSFQAESAFANEAPPIVHEVLRSPGPPLDATTLAFFEPRFNYDFSHVRVHTDAQAGESARAVNALAYTVGRDIVFGAGQFNPSARGGQALLAHELAHAVQQKYSPVHEQLHVGSPTDHFEHEADIAANRLVQATAEVSPGSANSLLQRQEKTPVPASSGGQGPPAKATPPASVGSSLCSAHPDELFYKTNPLFCRDTPSSGSMHAGFRCYREIPTGSGCPPGQHVCFDSTGKCDAGQSHVDSTAPSIKRNASGMCDLSWLGLCTIEHGFLDVIPALLAEGAEAQVKCIRNCQTLSPFMQGFCIQGCAGGVPY